MLRDMAFVDHITLRLQAGAGGDGVVRWLRNKMTARGGPNGGDGGRGGDLVLEGVRDIAALARYRFEKEFIAANGGAGEGNNRHGANGAPLVLPVPLGTVAQVEETGAEFEILEEGQRLTLFRGGGGGLGNAHFKSATNQNPFEHTDGSPGAGGTVHLSLKLIADAGLIGLPSAGKSSLLNALTRAKAKVGDYPFTTLEPNLADFYGYILADIPGLIEGASSGRGLGIHFLKHIERTGILLHLVSATQDDPVASYREVRTELEAFGHGLSDKREVIILSKIDLISAEERETKVEILRQQTGREVLPASVEDPSILKAVADNLSNILKIG